MRRSTSALITALALITLASVLVSAQAPATLLLKQERDGAPAQHLTAAEMASLGDPLFELVLKEKAHVTSLAELEDLIQPDRNKRRIFVVDENIANPKRGQARRSVFTFSGTQNGQVLDSNVMLSVFFTDTAFSDNPSFIEGWGWDNLRGRYNYYKMDRSGTPDGRFSWKLRGSSDGADLLGASDREGTCMACHVNGGPVMKELLLPWNNWHSFASQATYLLPTANPTVRWTVATSPRLQGRLGQAEALEGLILAPTRQFNTRRISASLARRDADGNIAVDDEGFQQVLEGKRLLRHLFLTTEYNIISSEQKSRLHPLSGAAMPGPSGDIVIPNSFFLNANLIGGGGIPQYVGLGISKSQKFSDVAKVRPDEYRRLVSDSGVKLGRKAGDADFAWLVPEPSHIDNSMVDRLMRAGILTPEFVAAAMAIDLETPVLSADRASLLQFVPAQFRFKPITGNPQPGRHPDDLTRKTIEALEAAGPAPTAPAGKFLQLLKSPNPISSLEDQVNAYHLRIQTQLSNSARAAELTRLHSRAVAVRRAVLADPVLATINETVDRLFPLPD